MTQIQSKSFLQWSLDSLTEKVLSPASLDNEPSFSVFGIGFGKSKTHLKAFTIYMKTYNALKLSGSLSKTVESLSAAVEYADDAAITYIESKSGVTTEGSRTNPSQQAVVQSPAYIAGVIHLQIFRAAAWLRRFAEDRAKPGLWFEGAEKEFANSLQTELKESVTKLKTALGPEMVPKNEPQKESKKELEKESELRQACKDSNEMLRCKDSNEMLRHKIASLIETVKSLQFYVRELEDLPEIDGEKVQIQPGLEENATTSVSSRRMLSDSEVRKLPQSQLISHARQVLEALNITSKLPDWRDGANVVKSLSPFGIKPIEQAGVGITVIATNINDNKVYEVFLEKTTTPREEYGTTGLEGTLKGALSPLSKVTIEESDPTRDFICIPKNAKSFAWAYPLDENSFEKFAQTKNPDYPDEIESFLLFGGYVYFDENLNFIRANALLLAGSQLQFSSPYRLTNEMHAKLVEEDRFKPVTVDSLKGQGAKFFAWVLPGEFDSLAERGDGIAFPTGHPGAFAYCYDEHLQHTSRDNAFVLAAVDSELR